MLTKTLACLLIVGTLSFSLPQPADAWGWLLNPKVQREAQKFVEDPRSPEKVEKVWDWIKDTASDIKEGIEDGINDLKGVNPMCVICSMTGVHLCSGSCSGSCSN